MTAAVIPSAPLPPPPPPPDHTATDTYIGDQRNDRPTARRNRSTPYLVPVPDCEPPFDDEVGSRLRPGSGWSDGVAEPAWVTSPDPSTGRLPNVDWTAVRARTTQRAPEAPVAIERAPEDPPPSPDRLSARGIDPPATPNRPHGAPRPERSTGLRRSAVADVLLLEPARKARPTTIAAQGVPPWSSEADIGVRKTASEDLPPAERAASVLARALVEVLSGQRPLAQLRVHCAPEIYAGLGERPPVPPMSLPHLLTVRVCEPADGVAEVGVAFRRADRVKALAFRIEGVDGRWRITALQVG